MLALVLVCTGLAAMAAGTWYGYAAARSALVPFVREGDATRALVEAARPVHERTRVRAAARSLVAAVIWISIGLYGMYLLTVGLEVLG
jgi:hypothetical protein